MIPILILSIEAPPLASSEPDTIISSSSVVVPPAESIIRSPEAVSISLSPLTPI